MHESGENYLETILLLRRSRGAVRSVDIANALGYSKPSISRAVGILKQAQYVTVAHNGDIQLTETGLAKANEVYERHRLITRFLMDTLDVSLEVANRDACRIEHILSQEVFDRIRARSGDAEENPLHP